LKCKRYFFKKRIFYILSFHTTITNYAWKELWMNKLFAIRMPDLIYFYIFAGILFLIINVECNVIVLQFVGVTFWVLMFVDRELVLPKALDPYFPWWLNHLMHTMIMVTTMLEMIFVPRQYPKRSRSLGILVNFMLTYLVW